jgi:shikimate kinase
MDDAAPPLLLFVVGPPAVGKMTVGQAIAQRTGLRLFHNHISIELALRYFDYGTPAFHRLDGEIRRRVIEEVAASDLPGLVFTFVWAFSLPEDEAVVDEYARPFRERGARVLFLELEAEQAERLRRNEYASRLAEKPSMRDVEASRRRLLELDARYQLNSGGEFDERSDYLRIDNTLLPPGEVAERVIGHFGLPRSTAANPA